jgi:hypothetical protein
MGQRTEEKQHQTRAIAASICFVMEEEEEEEEEDLRTVSRTGGVAAHKRVASHAFTLVRTLSWGEELDVASSLPCTLALNL